ncbi:polysaccharide pyruvyl transferase family protein [Egbenema bharatensis]|uniref:polysaccharide pyruvyl transferase family protein n=1 Tax=Egbenema bharatensis TaxID=3463334 RepID=UPI003A8596E6
MATTLNRPYANLGDALSPVIVSALSGLPIVHRHFDSNSERFACVGTIGQNFSRGTVHLWGTGVDASRNPIHPQFRLYQRPPNTNFVVHALRGPVSSHTFRREGIEVPDVYGDPVWFLPSIIEPSEKKQYELGVVVHLTELSELSATASTHEAFLRYRIPPELSSTIRIINTLTEPTFDAIEQKVKEITSCKRILSTSLHGLVIAEAYNIPCLHLRSRRKGATRVNLEDETEIIDQRMRDFYRGVGLKTLVTYSQKRSKETNWEDVIQAIDTHWQPLEWNPEPFLEAFPLPLKFNPLDTPHLLDRQFFDRIVF